MLEANDLPSSSRALVPVDILRSYPHTRPVPRLASFLTHLIATARQLPQTCERRRAEPGEAIATYKAAIAKLQAMNAAQ